MNSLTEKENNSFERKRVLIVDDDRHVRDSLTHILVGKGYNVHLALTGEGALESLASNSCDLLILDYSLPDINGLEVLGQIRKGDMNLPVIFMTGYGSEAVSIKAFKLGISDYFIKPFHPGMFEDSVTEIFNKAGEKNPAAGSGPYQSKDLDSNIEPSSGIAYAVKYLKENYGSSISLDKISKVACFSRSHFIFKFKQVMGLTFKDYLNNLRIQKAEEFLCRSDMTVSEVADEVGFNSLRHFERVFKGITGVTPGEYRKGKTPS